MWWPVRGQRGSRCYTTGFKGGERGHKPRKEGVCKLQQPGRHSPLEPLEGTQPCRHLDVSAHWNLFQTSDCQNWKMRNLCCPNPLSYVHLLQQQQKMNSGGNTLYQPHLPSSAHVLWTPPFLSPHAILVFSCWYVASSQNAVWFSVKFLGPEVFEDSTSFSRLLVMLLLSSQPVCLTLLHPYYEELKLFFYVSVSHTRPWVSQKQWLSHFSHLVPALR